MISTMAFMLRTNYFLRVLNSCKELNGKTTLPLYAFNKNVFSRLITTVPGTCSHIEEMAYQFNKADQILKQRNFISRRFVLDLFKYLKMTGTASPSQSLFLIRSCNFMLAESQVEKNAVLEDIWKTLLELDIKLDVSHYNAALYCFVENDHEFSSSAFLEDMEKREIEPNRVTFSRLIHKLCKDGRLDEANEMLETMKKRDMTLNRTVFNSLILGNAKANDLEGSLQIVNFMKEIGLPPDEDTYLSLALAYAEVENYGKLEAVLEECESKELSPTDKGLLTLINILARKNAKEEIKKIFNRLAKNPGFHQLLMMCCIQLLQEGHYEIAYQVVQFKSEGGTRHPYSCMFFPERLVEYGAPFEKVVHYCDKLVEDGINLMGFEKALFTYMDNEKKDPAFKLLEVMRKKDIKLREHYFYPLFCQADKRDIMATLQHARDLGFSGQGSDKWVEMILRVLEPIGDPVKTYFDITDLGFDKTLIYSSIINYFLLNKDLERAGILAKLYQRRIPNFLSRALAECYLSTGNVEDTIAVARLSYPFFLRKQRIEDQGGENETLSKAVIRNILIHIISNLPNAKMSEKLVPLLQGMKYFGVGIDSLSFGPISEKIGDAMSSEIEGLLNELVGVSSISDHEFRSRVGSTTNFRSTAPFNDLFDLIKKGSFNQAEALLEKIEADGLEMPPNIKYSTVEIFLEKKDLTKVEEIFESLAAMNYNFGPHKIIKYAKLLVDKGRISDASQVLVKYSPKDGEWAEMINPTSNGSIFKIILNKFLEAVIENGELNDLEKIQKILIDQKFQLPSYIYGFNIIYHIRKGDLESAVNSFMDIAKTYKTTTRGNVLMQACAEVEDMTKLQMISDEIASRNGRMFSLRMLACASLRARKYGPAERIFKTPGLRDDGYILKEFENFLREGNIEAAEKIFLFSGNLYNFDKKPLLLQLLNYYKSSGDTKKALELWTTIQEKNEEPGDEFLRELAKVLDEEGIPVPFAIPKSTSPTEPTPTVNHSSELIVVNSVNKFNEALKLNNLTEASDILKKGKINEKVTLQNRLIESLVKNNLIEEALQEAQNVLTQTEKGLRYNNLLDALVAKGDVVSIESLIDYFVDPPLRLYMSLGEAYFNDRRMDEYLNKFIEDSEAQKSFRPNYKFICQHLKENLDFEEKVMKCAESAESTFKPYLWSCIWDHKFKQGQKEEAEEIYGKHLKGEPMFVECHSRTIEDGNTQMIREILEVLKRCPEKRKKTISVVYSHYFKLLLMEDKIEEAIKELSNSLQYTDLAAYRVRDLSRLEKVALEKGIIFPFDIPKRESSRKKSSNTNNLRSSESD